MALETAPGFTPGPWRIERETPHPANAKFRYLSAGLHEDGRRKMVCSFYCLDLPEFRGKNTPKDEDLNLMAAAPDLFAACDAMMQAIVVRLGDRELHCDHDWPTPITDALCEELETMRQAIYKALGKSLTAEKQEVV